MTGTHFIGSTESAPACSCENASGDCDHGAGDDFRMCSRPAGKAHALWIGSVCDHCASVYAAYGVGNLTIDADGNRVEPPKVTRVPSDVVVAKLSEVQADGRACVFCAREGGPMVPVGLVDDVQVFACAEPSAQCPARSA